MVAIFLEGNRIFHLGFCMAVLVQSYKRLSYKIGSLIGIKKNPGRTICIHDVIQYLVEGNENPTPSSHTRKRLRSEGFDLKGAVKPGWGWGCRRRRWFGGKWKHKLCGGRLCKSLGSPRVNRTIKPRACVRRKRRGHRSFREQFHVKAVVKGGGIILIIIK